MTKIYNEKARPHGTNTCIGCRALHQLTNEIYKCKSFEGMDMDSPGYLVRCIQYDDTPQIQ